MDCDDLLFNNLEFTASPNELEAEYYLPSKVDCLRCGLCLSNCPTYSLFKSEAESPRGRIRSIDKVLNCGQGLSAEERWHFDNCLQCRACEAVCPGKMAYGRLFDKTRQILVQPPGLLARMAFGLVKHKRWRNRLMPLIWLYLKSRLQKTIRQYGLLKKTGLAAAESFVTEPALDKLKHYYPSKTARTKGKAGLFTGCLAEHFDRPTLQAAIDVLTKIGFDVIVPPEQGCCGAIHLHNGQPAEDLINNNIAVFDALKLDAIVYTASGCGVMLSEFQADDNPATKAFCDKLCDINDFTLKHWPDKISIKTANTRVAVHEPCSQRAILKNQLSVYALLEKIPGLRANPLPDNHLCCGAGGTYMLTHPENAATLRNLKTQSISHANADIVVSSNYGCAAFLKQSGVTIVHPVLLLAQHLS